MFKYCSVRDWPNNDDILTLRKSIVLRYRKRERELISFKFKNIMEVYEKRMALCDHEERELKIINS